MRKKITRIQVIEDDVYIYLAGGGLVVWTMERFVNYFNNAN